MRASSLPVAIRLFRYSFNELNINWTIKKDKGKSLFASFALNLFQVSRQSFKVKNAHFLALILFNCCISFVFPLRFS